MELTAGYMLFPETSMVNIMETSLAETMVCIVSNYYGILFRSWHALVEICIISLAGTMACTDKCMHW